MTRDFIDGTNPKLIKSFKSTIKFKVFDIGQDNLKNIVPGYVYNSGGRLTALLALLSGTKGAVQVVAKRQLDTGAWCIQVSAEISIKRVITLYMLGTTATLVTSAKKTV